MMVNRTKKRFRRVLAALAVSGAVWQGVSPTYAEEQVVNVYNWGNSIGKDTVANFEKATGIKVVYQEYDSNDTLQAKLLSGSSGFDVVVPSDFYWAKQVQAGIFQKIDLTKLSNFTHLDPALMKIIASEDPTHEYGIPWSWGTDGIGINVEKVTAALGGKLPDNVLDLLFDPHNAEKLKGCGISLIDSPADIFAAALLYLKKDPNSHDPADYQSADELLRSIRPYITQFNSSSYIGDLANNDICMTYGWSGDINTARVTAIDAKKPYHIKYLIPAGRIPIWFDMMAIPKDAPHPQAAMKFIDFVLSDKESASLTNDTKYPTAIPGSKHLIRAEIQADPAIYPPPEIFNQLFQVNPLPSGILRLETRLWSKLKVD